MAVVVHLMCELPEVSRLFQLDDSPDDESLVIMRRLAWNVDMVWDSISEALTYADVL